MKNEFIKTDEMAAILNEKVYFPADSTINQDFYVKGKNRRSQIIQAATNEITISIAFNGLDTDQKLISDACTMGLKRVLYQRKKLAEQILLNGFSHSIQIEYDLFDHLTELIKRYLNF